VNVFAGVVLCVGAFIWGPMLSGLISGVLLILVSIPKGAIIEDYASWNRFIK
jgi:hypothetical protein